MPHLHIDGFYPCTVWISISPIITLWFRTMSLEGFQQKKWKWYSYITVNKEKKNTSIMCQQEILTARESPTCATRRLSGLTNITVAVEPDSISSSVSSNLHVFKHNHQVTNSWFGRKGWLLLSRIRQSEISIIWIPRQ